MGNVHESVEGIAIIGMAGRFPGARNVGEFWENLRAGAETVSFFTDEELIEAGADPAHLREPNYVKAKGVLEDVEMFDASFFGFSPREAEIMDPQQRLFLECAWGALETAGYGSERRPSSIGVYGGVSMNTYLFNLFSNREAMESVGFFQTMLSNDRDYLTTRVSYELNLKGPSLDVQTGCSTSLVAVHLACQSLLDYHCDMALAGGVSVTVPKKSGYLYQPGGVASPDGRCHAFDARSQGTVNGNGLGLVVLKRLEEALADGDTIYAVIKGSAVNNDGSNKIGFTAPSVEGQSQVIAEAHAVAGVEADSVTYVETHGTGTTLGDPIEVAALTQAFRATTAKKNFCAIGSVKPNVGHLDAAAGVTGLIKASLALRHEQIPPSLNFETPNPGIDFANSPFFVNDRLTEWPSNGAPRRAGVSSFGIGGTNAHVVLEEAPAAEASAASKRPYQLLTLSAKTAAALERAASNLAQFLSDHPETNLADAAFTMHVGRKEFANRRAVVCGDAREAVAALEAPDAKGVSSGKTGAGGARVAMMFSGQGAQYVQMGRELYATEATFREEFDRCAELLIPHLGLDLRKLLFADESNADEAAERLKQTSVAQPALFAVEYALARVWMEWGVRPAAMIGHSIGEYVAACLAGVMSPEDALRLVAARGRLMQSLPRGAMLAVPLPETEVVSLLSARPDGALSLAAVNGAALCVVSGEVEAVDELERELNERGLGCRRLHTSHAFHSRMMEPVLDEFSAEVGRIGLQPPSIPFISNVSGKWITEAEATSPAYWARHLRGTVRFSDGLDELLKGGDFLLLEVGPGQTLSGLARQRAAAEPTTRTVVSSMRHPHAEQSDVAFMLGALGRLWTAGAEIDWPAFHSGEQRRRIPLPTYPFERQRYWVEPQAARPTSAHTHSLGKKPDVADWFYVPVWKQSVEADLKNTKGAHAKRPEAPARPLIFADEGGLGEQLAKSLNGQGREATVVHAGTAFRRVSEVEYVIDPARPEDYERLFRDIRERGKSPDAIAHLWGVSTPDANLLDEASFGRSQRLGFYSLLFLAQALGEQTLSQSDDADGAAPPLRLCVFTSDVQSVTGEETLSPEKATALGPCRVIAQEYPQVTCRAIDIVVPEAGTTGERNLVNQLADELMLDSPETLVAYRGRRRWVATFEAIRLEDDERTDAAARANVSARLREGGTYLLTGGTGGIGLELAKYLAQTARARLVLVGRSALPEREHWPRWIEERSAADATSRRLQKLLALEEMGAEVLVVQADVADESEMREALRRARERFGHVNGVIHAAGLAGGGIIQLKTAAAAAAVLAPKVTGTRVLDRLLKNEPLDFMVLFSSHRSILGGLGLVDYTAANAYLDAFARARSDEQGTFICSIIWDGWQEAGMAYEAALRHNVRPEEAVEAGMLTSEGVEAFRRALGGALPEVVVSTRDFNALLERSNARTAANELAEIDHARRAQPRHSRPSLSTAYEAPRNDAERSLAEIWQNLLGIEQVGVSDNFFELGGDSVLSIQIIAKANKSGLRLTPQQIFQHQTIAELASVAGTAQAVEAEQEAVTGRAPLTPIQNWFFRQNQPDPQHYNQALLLEVRRALDSALLERAVAHLLAHHDALRMRFTREETGWQQFNAPAAETAPFTHMDLSSLSEAEQTRAVEAAAAAAQTSLDLTSGPLIRVVFCEMGAERPARLLLVIHHLVVDAISWRILLEDLGTAYEQLSRGEQLALPPKTTSFKRWAEQSAAYAQSEAVERELDYWLSAIAYVAPAALPSDFESGRDENTEESARSVRVTLDAEETRELLQEVPQAYRTQINDVLLAALARTFHRWTGESVLVIDMEGHGRDAQVEDVDVTRTVGWFTTIYPVRLEVNEGADAGEILRSTKEQLRRLPGRGIGYGLLRYLHHDERVRESLERTPPEISFLYLGQLDSALPEESPFVGARESAGASVSPRARRSHLLGINGFVSGGQLHLDWSYSENAHRRSTIERLSGDYLGALREMIAHCLSTDAGGFTPSDFPDAELSQDELDSLLAELSEAEV